MERRCWSQSDCFFSVKGRIILIDWSDIRCVSWLLPPCFEEEMMVETIHWTNGSSWSPAAGVSSSRCPDLNNSLTVSGCMKSQKQLENLSRTRITATLLNLMSKINYIYSFDRSFCQKLFKTEYMQADEAQKFSLNARLHVMLGVRRGGSLRRVLQMDSVALISNSSTSHLTTAAWSENAFV